jgi:hypothetical protein
MFTITDEQRKQLLQYLMARPYAEVAQMVALLASLKPIESDDTVAKVIVHQIVYDYPWK